MTKSEKSKMEFRKVADETKNLLLQYLIKKQGMTRDEALAFIEKEGKNPVTKEQIIAAYS